MRPSDSEGPFVYAIRAEGLRKSYGDHQALRGVDLAVPPGTLLGVLGPNGAGKTTTVRILATLVRPDAGTATVAGHDVLTDPRAVRASIGLTGQYAALDERLTGRENLHLLGVLHGSTRRDAKRTAEEMLERFELTDAADRVVKGYSGGMRRRLDIASSLVGRPAVLFLDEPTTGLDPHSRNELWSVVRRQVQDGVTVLLTTQYLEEADQLAGDIVVIDHGAVVASGTPAELKRMVGGERVAVRLPRPQELGQVVGVLETHGTGEASVDEDGRGARVAVARGMEAVAAIAEELAAQDVKVDDFGVHHPTLDDVFLTLTRTSEDPQAERKAAVA